MTPRNSPTVWRRWLAAELKGLREAKGLHQKDVGRECGWSGARLSYLEHGQQVPTEDDLDQLLPLYGVAGDEVSRFYEAIKFAAEKGWWERTDERDMPKYLRDFVGLEQGASVIRAVEPYTIPGLLQTPSYTIANVGNDVTPRTERQIRRIADLRVRRQAVLAAKEPAEFDAVIDESVLHRVVGDAKVMAAQLDHLAVMNKRPNINIRVFPFERGSHPAMVGSYRILAFEDLAPILYLEHRSGAAYHDDAATVEEHLLAFGDLAAKALPAEQSAAIVEEMAATYRERVRKLSDTS